MTCGGRSTARRPAAATSAVGARVYLGKDRQGPRPARSGQRLRSPSESLLERLFLNLRRYQLMPASVVTTMYQAPGSRGIHRTVRRRTGRRGLCPRPGRAARATTPITTAVWSWPRPSIGSTVVVGRRIPGREAKCRLGQLRPDRQLFARRDRTNRGRGLDAIRPRGLLGSWPTGAGRFASGFEASIAGDVPLGPASRARRAFRPLSPGS